MPPDPPMMLATPSPPVPSSPRAPPPGRPHGPAGGATSSARGGWGGRPPPLHEDDDDGICPIVRGEGPATAVTAAAAAAATSSSGIVGGGGGAAFAPTPHHRRCYTLDDELEDEDAIGPAPPSDQLPPGAAAGASAFASAPALYTDAGDWERLAAEAADRRLALELHRSLNEGEAGSAVSPSSVGATPPPPAAGTRAASLSMASLPLSPSAAAAGAPPQRLRRQSPGEVAQEAADAALAARVQTRLSAAAGNLRLPPRLRHAERARLLTALRSSVVPGIRAALSRGAVLPPRASSVAVVGGYTLSALSVLHLTLADASVSLHPLAEGAVLRISPIAMDVEVGSWAVDGRAGGLLGAVGSGMGGSAVVGVSDISLVAKIVAARGEHGHVTGGVTVADCVVEGVGAEVYSMFVRGGGMFSGACVRPMLWSGVTAVATAALREALSVQVRGVSLLVDPPAAGATKARPPLVPASPGGATTGREASAAAAAAAGGMVTPAAGRSVSSLDAFLTPSVGATARPSGVVAVTPPPPAARRVPDAPPAGGGSQASLDDAVRAALGDGKDTGPDRNVDDEVDDASGLLSRVSTW